LILYVALCSIISYNYGGASGPQTGATPHRINPRDNNIKRLTTTQQYFSQYRHPKKIRPECRVTGRDNKNPNNFFHTVFYKSPNPGRGGESKLRSVRAQPQLALKMFLCENQNGVFFVSQEIVQRRKMR
jgi:hypothetical protein